MEHDQEASAHEEPIMQMRRQMSTMQANLETLRPALVKLLIYEMLTVCVKVNES